MLFYIHTNTKAKKKPKNPKNNEKEKKNPKNWQLHNNKNYVCPEYPTSFPWW